MAVRSRTIAPILLVATSTAYLFAIRPGVAIAAATPSVIAISSAGNPTNTAAPTPTQTPDPLCDHRAIVRPAAGRPGTIVALTGWCYWLHSGRGAAVYLDGEAVAGIGGETGGSYWTLFAIPPATTLGRHDIRVGTQPLGSAVFEVTRQPGECAGDCDGDGRVGIREITAAIAIALGRQEPDTCPGFGASAGDGVTVAHLIASVQNALHGCVVLPEPSTLAGEYSVAAGEVAWIHAAGGVHAGSGGVTVSDGDLLLELNDFGFPIVVGGSLDPDGSIALSGHLATGGAETVPVVGRAMLQRDDGTWAIAGEVTFRHPGASIDTTLRFVMSRPRP